MRLALALIGSVVVGACGTNGPSADQACTQIAQARCSELMTCSAADLVRRWPDLATCETREKLACTEGLAAPATGNNPSAVETCAAALATQACPAFLGGVPPPPQCMPQTGPAANGAACSFNAGCMTGFCAVASTALCGTCAAVPAPGDSCANNACGPAMFCVASTMLCQAPVASGGSCSRALPCGDGLGCVGATMTVNGTCTALGTVVGAACDAKQVTIPSCSLDAGLTCDTSTNMCVQQAVVGSGMTCGVINNQFVGCTGGAVCNRATGSPTGTCIAPAADAAACDATNGPFCEFPAKCVAGTCQLPGSMKCS